MRLDRIVLNGFKSFAEKTDFDFEHNITAIVGPNGCGKSNIVDAVKWVLGEQSVKSLRSSRMGDVIFAGSSSRKPAGRAEVSLHFSRTNGSMSLEQDQLQIARRLYRSGESEYLINNKTCRLKDVRELFMDTGVGVRAYSIIEQGQIDQLLHASKIDRRVIFDEAAGISKYKAHKKEALRKLDRTEQNLLRVADILGEVQKQLRSIKLQAGKAKSYLQHTERLKELRLQCLLSEFAELTAQSETKNAAIGELQERLSSQAGNVAKNDALLSELGDQIIRTENEINRSDNSFVAVKSKIEHNLERIRFLQGRLKELSDRKQTVGSQLQRLQEEKSRCENDLRKLDTDLADSDAVFTEKSQATEHLEGLIHELNLQFAGLQAALEDEKSGIIDIVRRTAQLHNEIQSISTYRDNLSGQKGRLFDRANTAKGELEKLLTEKAQCRTRSADVEKVLTDLQEGLDEKRVQIEELDGELTADKQRLAQCKEKRSAVRSELELLTDMENRLEGLNTAVKTILAARAEDDNKFDYVEAIIADVVHSKVEYANAVEAALEGRTDAVIINSTSKLLKDKEAIDALQARASFISTDSIEPFSDSRNLLRYPGVRGRLVEFVSFEAKYAPLVWKLLGHTLLVDSVDEALRYADELGGYSFVTASGELVSPDGMINVGPVGKTAGLISRKSRLHELENQLENLANEIAELGAQTDKKLAQKEHLLQLCKDLRTAAYEANTEKTELNSKLALVEQNVNRLVDEQPLITGEIDLLEEQIAQAVKKQYHSKQKLQELEAVNTERNATIQKLEAELAERRKQQQAQTSRLTELQIELGRLTEQRKAGKQAIANLQNQLQHLDHSIASAREDVTGCAEQAGRTQRDILNSEAEVSQLFVEKEKAARTSRGLHEKVEQLLEERTRTEQLLRAQRAGQADTEEQLHKVQLELSQFEVRKTDLLSRAQEELQIDLAESYTQYQHEDIDQEQIKAEIVELRGKIERLGNVNIDAITEQEQLEQRNEFLGRQVEDLNKSKSQLQQLISRINRESTQRFNATFEQIRGNFQQVFRKLFGGGKADIFLEDPADVLESGIEIMAKPPGKETRSISLLSGGEKAMTAIALLFAIFKTKPSPFCLLDEVDAALDEANNERFNTIVREFEKESQFIIVTHAKRTMSIADELIGITMQTKGVSKKISVKFDQFEVEESAAVA